MPLSPSQVRKQKERNRGIALLGLSAILLGVLIILFVILRPDPLDEHTLCPTKESKKEIVSRRIVVLDATDSFNSVQRTWIERQFQHLQESTPTHGNLKVFAVRAGDTLAQPLFDKCNPGSGEGLSRWTGNPDLRRREWEEGFQQPLHALLDSLITAPEAPSSPIMETIQAAVLSMPVHQQEPNIPRELHIFSDLLQHSDTHSHYGAGPPSYSDFGGSRAAARLQPDLRGFVITVYYVTRDDPNAARVQGRTHIRFWEEFFADRNGRLAEAIRVDG